MSEIKLKCIKLIYMLVIFVINIHIFCGHVSINYCYADELADTDNPYSTDVIDDKAYRDIDNIVRKETGINISYKEIMQELLTDNSGNEQLKDIYVYIIKVIKAAKKDILQIVCLCIFSALINALAPLFNEKQLKNTASGVIAVSLVTILMSVFIGMYKLTESSISSIINIYKVISMVFFPAVCASGSPLSAAGYYQIVIWMMMAADMFIKNILLNMVRIYICILLCDCIDKEPHFVHMCTFIKKGIKWCGGTILTLFMGINGIKSVINPLKDDINTSYLCKAVSLIPGIGDTAAALSHTVIASSALIKNTIGAAGVIVLIICMLFPVLRLIVTASLYQGIAAVMEPLADKRAVRAVSGLGNAVGCLTYLTIITTVLFILTLVLICLATG